jgi:ubiquinone/menaquinone biosynthesis C-methylase UbiE
MAETLIPDALTKLAYETLQQGKAAFGLAHKNLSSRALKAAAATGLVAAPPESYRSASLSSEVMENLRQRYDSLLQQDWQDAEQGVYPKALLFDDSWDDFVKYYPSVCLDIPQIWNRAHAKSAKDFAPNIETAGLPNYYTQNFHHQTDGYLSDRSAQMYDIQVEILFNGSADAMRRRILAPLKEGLKVFSDEIPQNIRVLDLACGTGRALRMIRGMLPKVKLHGIDLSEAYLRKANQLLSQLPGELPQLTQGAGEALPYVDNYFHALTSVFLFHELPAPIRQQVINEAFRVVKPGGTFIVCDSIQLSDSPELEAMMEGFPATFHEPFYWNYVQDNLIERLETAGFKLISETGYFMSKYLVAQKPL